MKSSFLLVLVILPGLHCLTSCRGKSAPRAADPPAALAREPFEYRSDGLRITGLMSRPAGAGPFPVVIVNHGGFDPAAKVAGILNFFVSHGFAAFASDYRGCGGSEGRHEVAKGELTDVLNLCRHVRSLPYVDGRRLAVWGFSHGGALALLAAARDPGIRAVVDLQGPVEMGDAWRFWAAHPDKPVRRMLAGLSTIVGGTPDQLPQAWRERSALYAADRIRCPVLLIYSDHDEDDAVPTSQGLRMEQALRAAGNQATSLILIPNANHGLDNRTWPGVLQSMLEFIEKHNAP